MAPLSFALGCHGPCAWVARSYVALTSSFCGPIRLALDFLPVLCIFKVPNLDNLLSHFFTIRSFLQVGALSAGGAHAGRAALTH